MVFNASFPVLSLLAIMMAATASGNALPEIRPGDYVAFAVAFGTCQSAMVALSTAAIQTLSVVPIYETARPILEAVTRGERLRIRPGIAVGGH